MWYKLILLFFSFLVIYVGRIFIIAHWPYGRLIYSSGLILCVWMLGLILYRMIVPDRKKKMNSNESD